MMDVGTNPNITTISPHIDYALQYGKNQNKVESQIINSSGSEQTAQQCSSKDGIKPKMGRKRKFQNQSRNERKQKANSNQKYINAKGQEVMPKVFDENFQCGCKKECTERFSLDYRKKIFDIFWSLGSYEARCAFLSGYVSQSTKARCYTVQESKRVYTRKYYFDHREVCKTAFLRTFQICQSRIDVVLKKKEAASFTDLRGKASGGNNKLPEDVTNKIMNHINSFPKYGNHYCKHKTKSKYLNTDLNLSVMYGLFKTKYANEITMPSLSTYKKIFYEKFDLKFKPKGSTCKTCENNVKKSEAETSVKTAKKNGPVMKPEPLPVSFKPHVAQYY